ncbi:hypothetical protein PNA2_1325 [Pyrococcus sp. NA2]|uniref:hypothetical protein n=1 Tax=Pyrococcus sp. (strain NA2) TaxID=342949 RepID=UPI000209ADF4|nr:hypothetical protein [Pyrococcus sp. NA2]AEC52240.1 hypothetical protein PNA2_1325 [Pyrococcus sp. NA2]
MARKPEYRNPRTFSVTLEAEIKEEIDEARGGLSYGKFFTILWRAYKGEVVDAVELETLRRENEELRKQNRELLERVEKLQREIERLRVRLEGRSAVESGLVERINALFSKRDEFKFALFLRELGFRERGDRLEERALEFVRKYFTDEGDVLVSRSLSLVIVKDSDKVLAWKVRRLGDGSFRGGEVGEVVEDGL